MPRYAPRTIGYACELLHAPRTPDPAAVQKVHNHFFEEADRCYSSFAVTPLGPILTNPATRQGVVSQVAFLADRFQFREEMGGLTPEDFAARVRRIADEVGTRRGIEFLGQQVTIRTLVNPQHFRDARALLALGMLGGEDSVACFGKQPGLIGVRFAFPPDDESSAAHSVRIESYAQDSRSLFLETQGSYGRELLLEGPASAAENVLETYRFLIERSLRFVANFDRSATT
ncbi:MAG: hypothetical protein H6831_08610 [Planctomycetes bacterium]|nr:hypothetical protein [Planctomycetota bacterium]MCB9904455.1 hypothetical protein [Planctomycetota bacterium]